MSGVKSSGHETLRRLLTSMPLLNRTPEWTQPVVEKPPMRPATLLSTEPLSDPFPQLGIGKGKIRLASEPEARAKVKTKGVANPTDVPPERIDALPLQREVLLADARVLRVSRSLFFDPNIRSTPGELDWTEFLNAMESVGSNYSKSGKTSGSSRRFTGRDHGISIDAPHPRGKIPFWMARFIGRRLNHRLGWDGTSFELRI